MKTMICSLVIVLILVMTALFAACACILSPNLPLEVAQPSGWPTTWTGLSTDPDEGGGNDHRDVTDTNGDGYALYYAADSQYLYLRMETVNSPGWPSTKPAGDARYKWWFDTTGTATYVSGTTVYNAEFLLIMEDLTDNSNDPDETRDQLGELTLMDDLNNDGFTSRWDSANPPNYTINNAQTAPTGNSSWWRRVLGNGTAGTGGPQGVMGADIGYRIDNATTGGNFTDIYVSWAALGNPSSVCLIWATDNNNTNLDQAPNLDRPEETSCLSVCVPPIAAFNATPTSGCAPLTVNFTDQSTGNITSWSWTFGDGGTSTFQNPSYQYTSAGSYNVTLNVTTTCSSDNETKTNYITVYAKPTATASSNSPVCEGATIELYGGPAGMTSYSWTGPNGFTSSLQNPTIPNATISNAGNYSLTVTDGVCTSDPANTVVVVNTKPTATASSNSPVCEGATIELYGGPAGMTSYSWTGPNGFTSSLQNPTIPNATISNAGNYSLTVTDGGCTSDPANTSVVVGTTPTATASSNSPVCEGDTIQLYGGPNGMASYNWTGPNGFTSSSQSPTIPNATTLNAGNYYLTVTDGGCTSDPANTSVVVGTKPTATASSNSPVCEGDTIQLYGGPNGMASYSWTGPNGFISSSQSPTIPNATTLNAGAYYLTVTDGGCTSDPANTTVVVGAKPTATASSNSPVSEGATIELYGGPGGMTTYSWTGPGGWTSSLQNPTRTGATTAMAGTYTLTVTNSNGCSDDESTSVIVNTKPTTKASSNPSVCCRSLTIYSTEGGSITTPGEGTFHYLDGKVVDLVASPDAGYNFVNWSGDVATIADVHDASINITIRGCYYITANFETEEIPPAEPPVEYELTISSTMGGSVTTPGEGTFSYVEGSVVILVAEPAFGYKFVNWTNDVTTIIDVNAATTTVTMNGDYSIKANFEFKVTNTDSAEGLSFPTGCFIATAAYGTPTAEQIDLLREFRDVVLLESTAASQFVALYYQLSPPIADFIARNELLRTLVREFLVDPVVWVVEATRDIWRN